MALQWKNNDSARTMTRKYNETAQEVEKLKESYDKDVSPIPEQLEKFQQELNKKLEEVSAEDIGLGNVDNTSDMDKPVSTAQQRAINVATDDMITSEPVSDDDLEDAEETGFITSINVTGTTLVISF